MISTFLVEYSQFVAPAFWVGVVLTAVVGFLALSQQAVKLLTALSGLSLVAALVLVFTPDATASAQEFCTVQFSPPFTGIETLANTALLLPFAVFAGLRSTRPVLVAAISSGLSALIEIVQGLIPGLGRACDTNDWLTNSTGAILGSLLAAVVLAIVRRRAGRLKTAQRN